MSSTRSISALSAMLCLPALFLATLSIAFADDSAHALGNGTARSSSESATPITLRLDARDAARHVLHAQLTIPVQPGPLTLVYPKWLPGTHGPTGPIADLVGLAMSANGQPVRWQRDAIDLYAFKVIVPVGVSRLDVNLDLVSGGPNGGLASPSSLNTELAMIKWSQVLLYPAGAKPADIPVATSLLLPGGWKFASALAPVRGASLGMATEGTEPLRFETVSLGTLVDSPLLAGRHFQEITLDDSSRPVTFAVAADSSAALEISPEREAQLRNMVREADALFGSRQFRRYVFLVALSDQIAQFGLESHESSENRVAENTFTNPAVGMLELSVLPHEYVHSWNGKYRRPAGLATPDFQEPMRGDLLWVYEGLTQYLGNVLAVRSGLWTAERYRERIAQAAAYYSLQSGRRWRPLADTAVAAQVLGRASPLWRSYRRSVDYYNEGGLVWLEADMLIREKTRNRRSLDDFCRAFFGGNSYSGERAPGVLPYTEEAIYSTLNDVLPFNWRQFFADRLAAINPPAPTAGLERGGWSMVYTPERNSFLQDIENLDPSTMIDLAYSIGLRLNAEGLIDDVFGDLPADRAGVAPGMILHAVNGRRWSTALLRQAISDAQETSAPIALLIENGDRFATLNINYTGGLKEPQLDRATGIPDRLSDSIAPRSREERRPNARQSSADAR